MFDRVTRSTAEIANKFRAMIVGLCLAFAGPSPAADAVLETVNNGKVLIPIPTGMHAVNPDTFLRSHPDVGLPEKTRVLAIFIPNGAAGPLPAYAMVQTREPPMIIPRGAPAQTKSELETKLGKTAPAVIESINRLSSKDALIADMYKRPGFTIRAKRTTYYKTIHESPDWAVMSTYGEFIASDALSDTAVFRPNMIGIARVNGAAVFFNYYGVFFTSAEDPKFVKFTREWADAIAISNGLDKS